MNRLDSLPVGNVEYGIAYLKNIVPEDAEPL